MKQTLRLRLIVTEPLAGVWCAMQRGKSDLVAPQRSADALIFHFALHVDLEKDSLSLTGEFAQGPKATRFVYVNSGTYAGQIGSAWSRRAKVPLTGISSALARKAISKAEVLSARVRGISKDGGPFCASVALLSAWEMVSA